MGYEGFYSGPQLPQQKKKVGVEKRTCTQQNKVESSKQQKKVTTNVKTHSEIKNSS